MRWIALFTAVLVALTTAVPPAHATSFAVLLDDRADSDCDADDSGWDVFLIIALSSSLGGAAIINTVLWIIDQQATP